jgi:hypothetical protein
LWQDSLSTLHGLATSNVIASLLLHENETNKVDSKKARKDKETGPIPNLPAQFVEKWGLLQDGGMHLNTSDCGEILSAHFMVQQLPMQVFCCIQMNQIG